MSLYRYQRDLLGEAYVDGVMDGEMFCESSQADIEIINIV
jgi:hypothetical protein